MTTVHKHPLIPSRIRRPPAEGWSWIDRRFVREHASGLGQEALLLYFFLAAVSDKEGLSYYSDTTLGGRLRMEEARVVRARHELEDRDLIAYQSPLYQILSLPERARPRHDVAPWSLGAILRKALCEAERPSPSPAGPPRGDAPRGGPPL